MTDREPGQRHVVVIGGGISGMVAARALRRSQTARNPQARDLDISVTLLEAGPTLGGKLRTEHFAGVAVDTGADAFLSRVPWARQLCQELGVETTTPSRHAAWLWSRDTLRRFPQRTVLGVPSSLTELARAGVVSSRGVARASLDYFLPQRWGRPAGDNAVGNLIRARFGHEVAERVVDPLIGGINASSIDNLSLDAAAPIVAEMSMMAASLMRGARHRTERLAHDSEAVFRTPVNGMSSLVGALAKELEALGVDVRTSSSLSAIEPVEQGWQLTTASGHTMVADGLVLATPANHAANLLTPISSEAAELLGQIQYSSVAMTRLAYKSSAIRHSLNGTGFVTPSIDGHLTTACTWTTSKWGHLARPGQTILRASVGRNGDDRFTTMSDDEIIGAVHKEISEPLAISESPREADVTRWMDSFPLYAPNHNSLILRIERALAPSKTIALCGAAYTGVGIPACIKSATDAADTLLSRLAYDFALSE